MPGLTLGAREREGESERERERERGERERERKKLQNAKENFAKTQPVRKSIFLN